MTHIKRINEQIGYSTNEHLNPNSDNLQSSSIYMTIRVDYTFDENVMKEDDVLNEIENRVIVDSKANGLHIDDVIFCGWNDSDNNF